MSQIKSKEIISTISIPKFLKKTGRRRGRKHTALSWANGIDITEAEFNNYLVELGYQFQNKETKQWERTPKALPHSKAFFRQIYWDIDVLYDVLKLRGKTEGTYFYCEDCGAYNKVEEIEAYICRNCGRATESKCSHKIDVHAEVWKKIKESVRLEKNLPGITYDTWIRPLQYRIIEDRFFVEAPFEEMAIGYLKQHYKETFKSVIRKETGMNYIVSFVQPGVILIEDE